MGCDLNSFSGSGLTPLEIAVSMGNYDTAELLLELGADINTVGPSFETPLFKATVRGELDEILFYLSHGAEFTVYYHGESALYFYISRLIKMI